MKLITVIIRILISACIFTGSLTACGPGRHAVSRGHDYKNQDFASTKKSNKNSGYQKQEDKPKNQPSKQKLTGSATQLITEAYTWLGTPYRYGSHTRQGTDCSGFVMEVFGNALNYKLPRSSQEQHDFCQIINFDSLQPGDLVFFASTPKSAVSHVGMYIGNDEMIHASVSKGVMVSNLFEPYYQQHYHSSGRVGKLELKEQQKPEQKQQEKPTAVIEKKESLKKAVEVPSDSLSSFLSNFMD